MTLSINNIHVKILYLDGILVIVTIEQNHQ